MPRLASRGGERQGPDKLRLRKGEHKMALAHYKGSSTEFVTSVSKRDPASSRRIPTTDGVAVRVPQKKWLMCKRLVQSPPHSA